MKVALINPADQGRYSVEPMGLGYIASFLEQNDIGVKIIDQMAGDNVRRELLSYRPDIVGITSMTPMAPHVYRLADACRRMKIPVVLGGPHPSAMPQEALEHCDIVVTGEGEEAMLAVIKEGITSGIVSRTAVQDIDRLPPPARHLMKQKFDLHTATQLKMSMLYSRGDRSLTIRSASVLSSRGCPFRCVFCPNSLRSSPVRFHSAKRVLEEVRGLKKKYGIRMITFLDDNFLVDKARLEEICRGLIDEKLEMIWCCGASAHYIDRKTVELIKQAGCRLVAFGIESGSQKVLDALGKSTRVQQNLEAIKICKDAQLLVHASFMLGNPGETREDVTLTQDFIRRTQPDVYYVNVATPYPGTKLWQDCRDKIKFPVDWRKFRPSDSLNVYPCSGFSRKEIGNLFMETTLIKPVVYTRNWKSALRYPRESLHWLFSHPLTAAKMAMGAYVYKRSAAANLSAKEWS